MGCYGDPNVVDPQRRPVIGRGDDIELRLKKLRPRSDDEAV